MNPGVIDHLSRHGAFFERWCRLKVASSTWWRVWQTEYPVCYPRPLPGVSPKETCIDIVAQNKASSSSLYLVIECKKCHPDFSQWNYFLKDEFSPYLTYSSLRINRTGNNQSPYVSQTYDGNSPCRNPCDTCIESKPDGKATNSNTSQTAAQQAALGALGLHAETYQLLERTNGEHPELSRWNQLMFAPVVVTTAKLFAIKFDARKVNPETGEMATADVDGTEVPWLTYIHPLSPTNQPVAPSDQTRFEKLTDYARMHIYVVNALSFETFLREVYDLLRW